MYVYVSLFPLVKPSVARSSKKSCWKLKHWLGLNVKTRKHRIACGDIVVEEVEERNNAGSAKHKETWTSLRARTLMTCNVCLQKTAVYWAVYEKSSGKDVALRGCRVKKNHPLVWHVKSKKISTSLRVGRREWCSLFRNPIDRLTWNFVFQICWKIQSISDIIHWYFVFHRNPTSNCIIL